MIEANDPSDMWPVQVSSCHKAQVSYRDGKIICLECGEFCSASAEDKDEILLTDFGDGRGFVPEEIVVTGTREPLKQDNPYKDVDRFEVVDETGRAYVKGSIYGTPVKIELSLQDNGKTLKVFVDPQETK